MAHDQAVVLMYHQIVPDEKEDGWVPSPLADPRYGVRRSLFSEQMRLLKEAGHPVVSLSDWISGSVPVSPDGKPAIIITFDDGYASDFLLAAPILSEMGFAATFFVSTGYLGKVGMLSVDQARALQGHELFSIGSHGVTHRFLSGLPKEECRKELEDSLRLIRDLSGESKDGKTDPVDLSAPGGRTGPDVARMAREAGFRALMSSEPGVLEKSGDLFFIPRLPVLAHHGPGTFRGLLTPGSWPFRWNELSRRGRRWIREMIGGSG